MVNVAIRWIAFYFHFNLYFVLFSIQCKHNRNAFLIYFIVLLASSNNRKNNEALDALEHRSDIIHQMAQCDEFIAKRDNRIKYTACNKSQQQ